MTRAHPEPRERWSEELEAFEVTKIRDPARMNRTKDRRSPRNLTAAMLLMEESDGEGIRVELGENFRYLGVELPLGQTLDK